MAAVRSVRSARLVPLLAVALACAAWMGFQHADAIDEPGDRTMAHILLSNPPASDSQTYRALLSAVSPARIEKLEMTKAQIWSVPVEAVVATLAVAREQGIEASVLGADWKDVLAPMPEGREMTPAESDFQKKMASEPGAAGMSMMMLPPAPMIEYALTADPDSLQGRSSIVLKFNDTQSVVATRTHLEKTADGYIWHGVIDGTMLNSVTLVWWPEGRLAGTINYRGQMYVLKNMGGAMHGVMKMAPDDMPPEHAPLGIDKMKAMRMKKDPLVTKGDASMLRKKSTVPPDEKPRQRPHRSDLRNLQDAPQTTQPRVSAAPLNIEGPAPEAPTPKVEISVLVAYTATAAAHYSDIEKDLIRLSLEQANESFRISGAPHVRLVPAHIYQTGYVEQGSHFEHVFRFADKGDGHMEEVHGLRDRFRADLAVLIVHDPMGCGLAAQVAATEDRAFAVVHHGCAAATYSLPHEIGHLIGARHDLELDDEKTPFPYGHGFIHKQAWRTMMGYKESCGGCQRLPIWSNPDVVVDGIAAGNNDSNNARVIALQAARVAAFR